MRGDLVVRHNHDMVIQDKIRDGITISSQESQNSNYPKI